MKTWDLDGKRVLITGAARGIGEAIAKRLHSKGALVSLVGLEIEKLDSIADTLGERAISFEVDVSDKEAVNAAVEKTVAVFGGLDVVIANAGIYHVSPLSGVPSSAIERTLDVNLYGVWHTLHATLPHIKKSKGYVLTIASMAALTHGPLMGAYAASKAAVEALTDSLRIELREDGVGVGCAYFGAIDTDLVVGGHRHPALSKIMQVIPAFIQKPAPLSDAIDVLEQGIRLRSSRIWAPGWIAAALMFRGIAQPILEWRMARSNKVKQAVSISYKEAKGGVIQDTGLGVALLAPKRGNK
ncbi:MAG: SDR family NAD(P)-dependent oxidoreductase [Pseudomonadales bacterium]|nr:SDR family NAD(P)-dependent oxidoreductase [Pseudomonadales bacterium]